MANFINSHCTTTDYSDLRSLQPGDRVRAYGMVHNVRLTKWGGFLILRKAEGLLQGVLQNEQTVVVDEKGETVQVNNINREMAVAIEGVVNEAKIKDPAVAYSQMEVAIDKIEIISRPATTEVLDTNSLKFGDEDAMLRFKFDNRHVTLRNPRDMAILRVQSAISQGFAQYLHSQGFTQIYSPKIVSEGAEGGANVFKMDYFDKQVYLAQSPQFYKQIGVGVYERVFEIAPAYRAEKHATSRHLNEFISMDVEMGFIKGQEDVMELEMNLLRNIMKYVSEHCAHELQLLNADMPAIPDQIPAYRLSECHELLWNEHLTEEDHRGEDDMAPEEERAICKYVKEKYGSDFVFITHFPSQHRAFYAMDDPEDGKLTLSFDLLMRGLEITSGGQRMHEEADYRRKMVERGMDPEKFHFYMDTFHNGMPPHGGFAIGLERLTACILNIANVKECSMFPRDINRVAP
ncbi:MAG: aspartate--tRNA(Asn) ligase [Paludibacteraceae bacterium]|nr:aspartate--tRNA(Asn) ligase [Paludibacteraceae bacterium]